MVNQYPSKCNNLTTSTQCLKSVFVCGSAGTGEQFAAYFPAVITQEVSVHNLCLKQNIHRKVTTLNQMFQTEPKVQQASSVTYLWKAFLFFFAVSDYI